MTTTSAAKASSTTTAAKRIRPTIPQGRKPAEEKKANGNGEAKAATPAPASTPTTTAAAASTASYQERMRKLPAARRIETKVQAAKKRFDPIVAFTGSWEEHKDVAAAARHLQASFGAFLDLIKVVPDSFKPKGTGSTPNIVAPLEAGAVVSIREKYAASYEDVVEKKDQTELTVVKVTEKGKVVCKSKGGETLVFPRGHVARKKSEETKASEDA